MAGFRPLRKNKPITDVRDEGVMLRVTEDHCDRASPRDPCNCALALAAKDQFRGLFQVQVLKSMAYFEFVDHVDRYYINARTQRQINALDNLGTFDPGDYHFGPVPFSRTKEGKRKANAEARETGRKVPSRGNRTERTYVAPRGQVA